MKRSNWKSPYIEEQLIKKISKKNKNLSIKTMSRNSIIFSSLVNKTIQIHNGKTFLKIKILDEMIGHKLGEFAPTRKTYVYKKKNKQKWDKK